MRQALRARKNSVRRPREKDQLQNPLSSGTGANKTGFFLGADWDAAAGVSAVAAQSHKVSQSGQRIIEAFSPFSFPQHIQILSCIQIL